MVDWAKRVCSVVEIDIDRCTREFGTAPCLAALGGGTVRKCYNSYTTCAYTAAYNKGVNTLRFNMPTFPINNGNYLPFLRSVGGYEQTVNLNGFDDKLLGIGQRASVSFTFEDAPYSDVLTDKYYAGRMDGTAQIDEGPYNPSDRGSFWGKFRSRNPNFAGRPLRHIEGYINDAGEFVAETTRHYVIEDIEGPDSRGNVTIKAKDILSLADNKKALAPVASRGKLRVDMTDTSTSMPITVGIGSEYPASGYVVIGSEIIRYTRSGDTLTAVERGAMNTAPSAHRIDDTVQVCYYTGFQRRIDEVIRELLVTYGNVPAAWIDWAGWQSEVNVWGLRYLLTGIITKPEEVVKLIGEICQCFGVSLWWDAVAQRIRLKLNHPIMDDPVAEWNDSGHILRDGISVEVNDEERITRVMINTVQKDPTQGTSESNFLRTAFDVYATGERPELYGISRTEVINNRWMNHGDDTFAFILSGRLLARYKRAPATYTVKIDDKDLPQLTDVIQLRSYKIQDDTGKQVSLLAQPFNIKPDRQGSSSTVKLQEFLFTEKYARFAPNSTPVYTSASEYEKRRFGFWANPAGKMSNGDDGYKWA